MSADVLFVVAKINPQYTEEAPVSSLASKLSHLFKLVEEEGSIRKIDQLAEEIDIKYLWPILIRALGGRREELDVVVYDQWGEQALNGNKKAVMNLLSYCKIGGDVPGWFYGEEINECNVDAWCIYYKEKQCSSKKCSQCSFRPARKRCPICGSKIE